MPAHNVPALPPGFTLDSSGTPPLPPGFTLDSALETAPRAFVGPPAPTGVQAFMGRQEHERAKNPMTISRMVADILQAPLAMGEFGASVLTSIPAGVVSELAATGAAAGNSGINPDQFASDVQGLMTYQPRTRVGKQMVGAFGEVMAPVGRGIDWLANRGENPSEFGEHATKALLNFAPIPGVEAARGFRSGMKSTGVRVDPVTQALRDARGGDSAGAAAATINPNDLSPELRSAIESGVRRGRQVDQAALQRQIEAESLPVPMRLTEGEATQSPIQLSLERNLRGKHPEMALRMDEANKQLGQNLQALRDQIGPEVYSANVVEHGDTLISAYKAADEAANTQINALYQQLRDANGGAFPVDARALFDRASAMLHKSLLFDHAPPAVMTTLNRLAKTGQMTFENFESLRTNLARIQRSASTDGNTVAAAAIIRQAMEELPLAPQAAALKPLADKARSAARAHFQQLERDPAYTAAVRDSVPPDRFVQRFVVGAPRDQLGVMFENIGRQSETARQTMAVAALDYLRDAARLDANYAGNFSSAGFAKALSAIDPKANILFDARTAETLGKLRNVSGYTTFQPRGSFVNNSNTAVASAAKYGSQAAEGAVNVAFHGVPVGTWGRSMIDAAGTRRQISNALKPGAGVMQPRPKKK